MPSSLGPSLENIPLSSFHWRLIAVLGGGFLFDYMDLIMISFVVVPLASEWELAPLQVGFLFTAGFTGMLIGSLLAGFLADRLGRKTVFQFNLLIFSLFTLASAFAPDYFWLWALRLIAGVGIGGEIPVGFSMLEEFVPARRRGMVISIYNMFAAFGAITAAVASSLIIPSLGWRVLLLFGGTPALFVWAIRRELPESPRWLEGKGRYVEARNILDKIARGTPLPTHTADGEDDAMRQPLLPREAFPFLELFSKPYLRRTTMLWVLWFLGFGIAFYGLQSWLPLLLLDKGLTIVKSFVFSAILWAGGLVSNAMGAYLLDRVGRKWLMVTCFGLSAVLAYLFSQATGEIAILVVGFALFVVVFLVLGSGLFTYTPELYPTRARATGMGASAAMLRLGGLISPIIIGSYLPLVGASGVFVLVLAFPFVACAIVLAVLGEETKRRPLEEISK